MPQPTKLQQFHVFLPLFLKILEFIEYMVLTQVGNLWFKHGEPFFQDWFSFNGEEVTCVQLKEWSRNWEAYFYVFPCDDKDKVKKVTSHFMGKARS